MRRIRIHKYFFLFFWAFICLSLSATSRASGTEDCRLEPPISRLVVNVRDKGAKGDGNADDTLAIQSAVDEMEEKGGTVFVPDGTYLVDAVIGIQIRSRITFQMATDAVLKALPNDKANYSIINVHGASNVNIVNGTLMGERDSHSGNSGEWGMGILLNSATNVVIKGVTANNNWGDGFYITGSSKNIKFCAVIADNNRRQGMSVISVDGLIVQNSVFKSTTGTAPQAGLDLEPDSDKDTINNVQILNSQFFNNKGFGIQFADATNCCIRNVTIDANTIDSNLAGGIALINTSNHKITNNVVKNNKRHGILLVRGAKKNTVTGNNFIGQNDVSDEGGNIVSENYQN